MANVSHSVTRPKPNGRDPDVPLDPRIVRMVEFLDRAIRSQNVTVGIVVAAVGILLGRKVARPEHLDSMVKDMSMAIRVGYFFNNDGKRKETGR